MRGETPGPFTESSIVLDVCSLEAAEPSGADGLASVLARMDPWKTLGYGSEILSRYLTRPDPGLFRYTVTVDGGTAGCLCIRHPWLMGPFLELLAVFPGFQGQGLGKSLVRWLEREARPSCRNLWTTVSSFNTSAAGFYDHMGFERAGTLDALVKAGFDEILLRKILHQATGIPTLEPS